MVCVFCFMQKLVLLVFIFSSTYICAQNSILGRTKGQLPYLEYGLGDDRLGGAKMTYIDTNVLVKVVDSSGTDFKVQLSQHHTAWMPKTGFYRIDTLQQKPYYLSGSWRVWGDDRYDYVTIALPEKLPYRSLQQVCPSRIVVDIFGATSNTNWITQLKTAKEIHSVWYEQIEDDVLRVYIQLQHEQHWGYSVYYRNNVLQIKVKQQPVKLKLKHLKVAIDAGHGGANAGAKGLTTNILEKDYTLKIAKQLEAYLKKKGAEVYMTRSHDTDITMINRTMLLKEQEPDVLLSIHLNSSGNTTVKGTSTYYRYIGFRPLTQYVLDRMLELDLNNFGNIGSFNFSLSGPTEYPNCLVEVAFLSNEEDEKRIADERFHKDVARKITHGLEDWLKSLR